VERDLLPATVSLSGLQLIPYHSYMQFHPLAYIVKLNIEMSMADLIGKIARNKSCGIISEGTFSNSLGKDVTNVSSKSIIESRRRTFCDDEIALKPMTMSVSFPRRGA
jgi:hypothetical protein